MQHVSVQEGRITIFIHSSFDIIRIFDLYSPIAGRRYRLYRVTLEGRWWCAAGPCVDRCIRCDVPALTTPVCRRLQQRLCSRAVSQQVPGCQRRRSVGELPPLPAPRGCTCAIRRRHQLTSESISPCQTAALSTPTLLTQRQQSRQCHQCPDNVSRGAAW